MGNGVRTIDLDTTSVLDDLLGNRDGSTVRVGIDRLTSLINARLGPSLQTLSELNSDLDWPAGAIGTVWTGAESEKGIYIKSGASGAGSWSRFGDLPVSTLSRSLLDVKADRTALALLDETKAEKSVVELLGLSQAGGLVGEPLWTSLEQRGGDIQDQVAEVSETDSGFHVDPVSGETVANASRYRHRPDISPGTWEWIGPTLATSLDTTRGRQNEVHNVLTYAGLGALGYGTGRNKVQAGERIFILSIGVTLVVADAAASDAHVDTADIDGVIRCYVEPGENGVNVRAWGVDADGVDRTAAIVQADKVAAALGVPLWWPACHWRTGSYYAMSGPIRQRATWHCAWNATEIRLVDIATGETNPGFFRHGRISYDGLAALTHRSVPAWGKGDRSVDTGANVGDFSVGDMVWLQGGGSYDAESYRVYATGLLTTVEDIVGSVVYLADGLPAAESVDTTIAKLGTEDNETFASEGIGLIGMRLISNIPFGVLVREGGLLRGKIDLPLFDGDSALFGNAFFDCDLAIETSRVDRHLLELAYNSLGCRVRMAYGLLKGDFGTKSFLRTVSESARYHDIEIGRVDMPELTSVTSSGTPTAPILLTEASFNRVVIRELNAPKLTSDVFLFWNYNRSDPGDAPLPLEGNILEIHEINAPLATRAGRWRNSGGLNIDNVLRNTHFNGEAVSDEAIAFELVPVRPRIENSHFASGYLDPGSGPSDERVSSTHFAAGFEESVRASLPSRGAYRDNTSAAFLLARDENVSLGYQETETTVANTAMHEATYAAGTLEVGDTIAFEITGRVETFGGTAAARNVRVVFGGQQLVLMQTSATGYFSISGSVTVTSVAGAQHDAVVSGVAPQTVADAVAVPDVSLNSTALRVEAWLEDTGNKIRVRRLKLMILKPGCN